MYIVDQDGLEILEVSTPTDKMSVLPVINNGVLMGFNLFLSACWLGTFDSTEEAETEKTNINCCAEDTYYIGGSMDDEEFEYALFGGDEDD